MSDEDVPESVERWTERLEKANYVMAHINLPLMLAGVVMALWHVHKYLTAEMYAPAYWAALGAFVFISWFGSNLIDVLVMHGYLERVDDE